MKTIKITKKDLDKDGFYKKNGIGKYDAPVNANVEIDEGLGIVKFREGIYVSGYIWAKENTGIRAGEGIRAGLGIRADGEIEAGWGIRAGLGIKCGTILKFSHQLFAGICTWRKTTDEDKKIICGKLEGGTVEYGIVEERGLPKEKENSDEFVEIDGIKISKSTIKEHFRNLWN